MGFTFLIILMTLSIAFAIPINNHNYLVMPHSGSGPGRCLGWRFGVETNNIQEWTEVPGACSDYVGDYMVGIQYPVDCDAATDQVYKYAKGLNLTGDGKDVFVFDVDETVLSNLPYFLDEGWKINVTTFAIWIEKGDAPAIPEALKLYRKLIKLGFKIVFLTGATEDYRATRTKNLKTAGFTKWEKLLLRGPYDDPSAVVYKSSKRKELEEKGYRIRGNVGDQWSDLTGTNTGDRTFKMPNPMYYVP